MGEDESAQDLAWLQVLIDQFNWPMPITYFQAQNSVSFSEFFSFYRLDFELLFVDFLKRINLYASNSQNFGTGLYEISLQAFPTLAYQQS